MLKRERMYGNIFVYRKGKRMKGRVKWWSEEQGYGFIELNENENVFAHVENADRENFKIVEDQEIEFDLEEKENGRFLKILQTLEN